MSTTDFDDLSDLLSSASINETQVKIEREVIGSYNWHGHNKIYIPGIPNRLKSNFLHIRVGKLPEGEAGPEYGHANEYYHDVYFEPVQAVLSVAGQELTNYDILSDRNNIRKIDAALRKENDYEDFDIYMKIIRGVLVLKREDIGRPANIVGHEFEKRICEENYPFDSCHLIEKLSITKKSKSPVQVLLRGEVDACSSSTTIPRIEEYKLTETTDTGLKIYRHFGFTAPRLSNLREIKMAKQLKESHHFQSWVLGIPKFVHGLNYRSESATVEISGFPERLSAVVDALLACKAKMEEGQVYKLYRRNGGKMGLSKSSHERTWLHLPAEKADE